MKSFTSDYSKLYLKGNIDDDLELFKAIFRKDDMLRIRTVNIGQSGYRVGLVYIDGMASGDTLDNSVVRPMILAKLENVTAPDLKYIENDILYSSEISYENNVADMLRAILYGDTVLITDGETGALAINTKGFRTRGISEPTDERVLQGPREGFEEAALLNLAMIRRKLQTPDLCMQKLTVGKRSETKVFVCYLESLADEKTVKRVKNEINKMEIDGILDSNYIAEFIRDKGFGIFKTTGTTERPDIVAARMLEGRIAVVVDGTPVVLTLPYLFSENFQSDEDYYLNASVAAIGRVIRYIGFIAAVSVPAIFVTLTTFHIQLLPTPFMVSVANLRKDVPMSSTAECLILILVFEILKESGLRTPESLGSALSIVGGLVIGQAAVDAKIISVPMLIAVAISGISGLMIPRLKSAVFYLRIILVIASSYLGMFGYIAVCSVTLIYILSLDSFGTSSTVSLEKANFQSIKDTFFRAPWRKMVKRPDFNKDKIRQGKSSE